MYFTAQAGVSVSPYLAMELMYETDQTNSPWYTEIGSTVVNVTDDVPSYVPTPPPGYSTVYESQNLPIPQNAGIDILVIDTRNPAICSVAGVGVLSTSPVDGLRHR